MKPKRFVYHVILSALVGGCATLFNDLQHNFEVPQMIMLFSIIFFGTLIYLGIADGGGIG